MPLLGVIQFRTKKYRRLARSLFSCKAHPLMLLHLKAAPAVLVNIPQIVISSISLLVFTLNKFAQLYIQISFISAPKALDDHL